MMFKGEELSVIQTIKPVYRGQEWADDYPAHMSLVPWFNTEYHNKEFLHREVLRLGENAISRAMGVKRSLYLLDYPYVGCELDLSGNTEIRDQLLEFVTELEVDFHDEVAASDWTPHVADTADVVVYPGDVVEFGSLALISSTSGLKRVEASYYIGNHDETTPR